MSENLDLSPLKKVLAQLEKAYNFSISDMAKNDEDLYEQFRNSTLQCYEFTFELSWKFIKRKIEQDHPSPEQVDSWDYKELIREAAIRKLITSPEIWFNFRKLRNLSSHAYDQSKAILVYSSAKGLLIEATFLLNQLSKS
jgi:nucleotidyltransferase substrate binding protein (TIGR01987 family)